MFERPEKRRFSVMICDGLHFDRGVVPGVAALGRATDSILFTGVATTTIP